MKIFVEKYLKYLILALIIYMPLFGFLNTLPIRIWDESRLAINAVEMLNNHDYIVTHFNGKPDMWNTKPPLLIWMQVLFMKYLGVNELAVRLPSAFAAFFTVILMILFSNKYLKSSWFGIISVLVLITSQGYISIHGTRTGDYDAMLTLFTTLSIFSLFAFTETKKNKYLYLFFFSIALAVLTKSIAGLLFLPAMFIYILIQKQLLFFLKNKHFYIGLSLFLVLVIAYYFIREMNNEGYIKAVMNNEFGGRFNKVLENHRHGFWYYYNNFIDSRYTEWIVFVPIGVVSGFFIKNDKINRLILYLTLLIFTYFLIISSAQTRISWYDLPLYPLFAIIVTVFLYFIFQLINTHEWINNNMKINIMPYVFVFLMVIVPYNSILYKTFKPIEKSWKKKTYKIGYYIKDAIKGKHDIDGQTIVYKGYKAHILFYLEMLEDKNIHLKIKNVEDLSKNEVAIISQKEIKKYIEKNYDNSVLAVDRNIITYEIHGKK